ncbi:serine hydrolase domain-containing protein [Sediminibacterium soli]|uniref:serine hydrolase domain-containing protein n=1 Tax=Sediminibacterium soli TaxID=2698829 RepID=UPI00137B4870|nr:serine hydrolase domain-containing protein [Sediminibacterium soli]NCI46333.1 beta-lactamase family protein [Sediminibacterium soli]
MMMIPILTLLIMACGSTPTQPVKDTFAVTPSDTHSALSPAVKQYYANAIEPLYQSMLVRTGFNGSILLAKNGEIVFEDYRGMINFKTKEPITSSSVFHVASVSKTFTAMVVLKLMEEGKLSLDDAVEKYLPGFPYPGIHIRELLNHRSGLPKYDHFMSGTMSVATKVRTRRGKLVTRYRTVKSPVQLTGLATNEDVLQYMIRYLPAPEASPNRRYNYCNTNFAMLALIVEKITHTPFPEYMEEKVFKPLGMNHTYIFSIRDTADYIPSYTPSRRPYELEKLDCVYGDKNVYTNVRDLLLWDKALYDGKFLSQHSLDLAYTPYSNEKRGVKNYGLGWHLLVNPNEPVVPYHNGWWHGNNAVFKRLVADTATVIILGNKFNSNIWRAGKMSSVFTGRPDTTLLDDSGGGGQ